MADPRLEHRRFCCCSHEWLNFSIGLFAEANEKTLTRGRYSVPSGARRGPGRQSGHPPYGGLAENQGVTNRIQSLLGVEYPVVQAPMTYIPRAELAAAVSEGGGMGMIQTLTPEGRADLRRVRQLPVRPVAATLMIQGWKRDPAIIDELVAAQVPHVFPFAGDPALFTARLH